METSLHRQLKEVYAAGDAQTEVRLGSYRIDVVRAGQLIEIQHGHLLAIRRKVAALLKEHCVTIVKPIVASKQIISLNRRGGKIVRQRSSPKHGKLLDAFHDLLHFTKVFPHARLEIELILVDVEELRYPGHGRRRRWRLDDFVIEDQRLVAIHDRFVLREACDLRKLLAVELPGSFHTGQLATALQVERWVAQRIAYCLREMGAARVVGKSRGALLYEWIAPARKRAKRAA